MKIEDTRESLLKLIGQRDAEFYIPLNQRKYSWEVEQLDDYFQDLKRVIENNREHYMGVITMIESQNGKKIQYKVVDGQQRIITTIILLCVIRDLNVYYYNKFDRHNNDFKEYALEIQKEYLSLRIKGNGWQIKLAPCKYDRDLLIDMIDVLCERNNYSAEFKKEYLNDIEYIKTKLSVEKNIDESLYVNSNIIVAYNKFYKEIITELEEISQDENQVANRLRAWCEAIDDVRIFGLTSNNESNLFDYFESLNTKGLKLSQVDLVRNKLIKVVSNKFKDDDCFVEEISEIWDSIVDNTDEFDPVRFLKYFYMCEEKEVIKYGDIPELFEKLFNKNIMNIKSLIDKIERFSRIYNYLYNENLYEGYNNEHYYLKYLGQEACYSFLMYVIYKYEENNSRFCKKVFKYVENIIFFRILSRKSVKGIDDVFKNLIKKLDEYDGDKNKIFKYINSEINKYGDIEEFIKERKWKNEKILRYTLMKYNNITFTKDNFVKGDIKVKKISKDEEVKYNIGNFILKDKEDSLTIEERESKYISTIKNFIKDNEEN